MLDQTLNDDIQESVIVGFFTVAEIDVTKNIFAKHMYTARARQPTQLSSLTRWRSGSWHIARALRSAGPVNLLVRFIRSNWFNWFVLVRFGSASGADLIGSVCGCWFPMETRSQCGNLRAPITEHIEECTYPDTCAAASTYPNTYSSTYHLSSASHVTWRGRPLC